MVDRNIPEDFLRDLVQCVQAARDGAPDGTLFAMQCDLVLSRANTEIEGILARHNPRRGKLRFGAIRNPEGLTRPA